MWKLFIVIFIIIGNTLSSQDLLNEIVYGGNIGLLDNSVTIDQFLNFSRSDLRILRNTIYAKYGYIFNSKDLQVHFSQFHWYSGVNSNVDDKLTAIDKENIEFIQRIERNYPESNNPANELIGNWYSFGAISNEGIENMAQLNRSNRVQIMPNGIYVYYVLSDIRISGTLYGLWSLKNNIFETIPIGEHLVHLRSPANNIDEYIIYFSPTYGKVENFRISLFQLNDGSRHFSCDLFNHGGWLKE